MDPASAGASVHGSHHRGEGRSIVVVVLGVLVAFVAIEMVRNYSFPDFATQKDPQVVAEEQKTPGVGYVDALLHLYDDGMRPWLVNDRVWPTVLLDNPQNFQMGLLEAVRYGVLVLRNNLTRLRTTDLIDPDVDEAYTRFSNPPNDWFFPSAEARYKAGAEALRRYRARLASGQAHFYPRADNLMEMISQFNSLLGGANTRLYNCVGNFTTRISEEMSGAASTPNPAGQSSHLMQAEVPWSEIDDQFYYAQGVAFGYHEIMEAVLRDFAPVLAERNATSLAQSIVRDFLDYSQFEPLYIANGSFGSMWANHPYQLLGLLSQSRERARSLNSMLTVTRE